jgi:hypothetical protein
MKSSTAPPQFDLVAVCASCHTSLSDLSEHTGIPQEELLAFSNGAVELSARDYFAVMSHLAECAPNVRSHADARRHALSVIAHKVLLRDVKAQDEEANS